MKFVSHSVFAQGKFYSAYVEKIEIETPVARQEIEPEMFDTLEKDETIWQKKSIADCGLVPFVRHSKDDDVLVVVNYSNVQLRAVIGFESIFNYYRNVKDTPRVMKSNLVSKLCSEGTKIKRYRRKLRIELPAWGYGIFHFHIQ
jgi:hypothetical protein